MRRVVILLMACWGLSASQPPKTYSLVIDENHFLPYYHTEAPNKFSGFARKLLDRFAEAQGFRFEYVVLPTKRLQYLQVRNRFDFRFPDSPHWAAADKTGVRIVYSNPVVGYRDGIFIQDGKSPTLVGSSAPHFAVLRGFTPLAFQELIVTSKVRFLEVSDYKAAFKMLKEGRVHGIYGNEAVLRYQYADLNSKNMRVSADYPYSEDSQRLSSLSHGPIIDTFNVWLQKNDPWLDKLFEEFQLTKFRK